MIQDPTDQYIATILAQCEIEGKALLEIGCGKGRITRDLARHARRVVAVDPDAAALDAARKSISDARVLFLHAASGIPALPGERFDVVLYTLSLHHVPAAAMRASLQAAASLLVPEGVIVVIEPGDDGSFTEAKERFGAGSGDERPAREAALRAMHDLSGWNVGETVHFRTLFQFVDEDDFFRSLLPDYQRLSAGERGEVAAFLRQYRTADGIILSADRRLNLLRPAGQDSR